ncbi:Galactose mutarotase-like domain [Pseudocohnilembus persalinus]|uniref:Aldose 1-epimerase n=1 Tax=Pseudocohnilembus persalinus TaxID=266149 RepID=A0A0V0QB11_PSEPJ|nr:Galactose mutarotase-like domain [Pseudocohnilembus persalinus]|eukprot:KRW99327.1 Galactose mutarotase-like domain [Pseudocohnilembus persalinus]
MAQATIGLTIPILSYYAYKTFSNRTIKAGPNISYHPYGKLNTGEKVQLFTLSNGNMKVQVTNFGATLVGISVPDKNNLVKDVLLGCNCLEQYVELKQNYGNLIGRFFGRIQDGKFKIDDKEYQLERNSQVEGVQSHINGGSFQLGKRFFEFEALQSPEEEPGLKLHYTSKDGEAGYPGNLQVSVTYWLLKNNSLRIDYEAQTDKKTIVNLTNQLHFNLLEHFSGGVENHQVKLNSSKFLQLGKGMIPTGNFQSVENSAFDFRKFKAIGQDINEKQDEQLERAGGYNHFFAIESSEKDRQYKELVKAAEVQEKSSGRKLEIFTSQPAILFYSGNDLGGIQYGKENKQYSKRGAFSLAPTNFPVQPGTQNFPSLILEPSQAYKSSTLYRFSNI